MLNRIKQTASSKKGESYIYVCVLVLFISMLVSVVILYMGLMAQVQIQKRDVKMKLDSCVSEFATEAFDSIKQGDNYEFMLDLEKLKENAYRHLGFGSDDASITYENGNCTMSRPTVTTLSGNGFGLTAAVHIGMEVDVLGNGPGVAHAVAAHPFGGGGIKGLPACAVVVLAAHPGQGDVGREVAVFRGEADVPPVIVPDDSNSESGKGDLILDVSDKDRNPNPEVIDVIIEYGTKEVEQP